MSRNADAVGSVVVPRLLRKLGKISRLGVDDLVNEYALKSLPYDGRVRLFCALLRRANADTFAEAFNASAVAMRRHLASKQGLSKTDLLRLQKEAKARLARVLTDELAHFGIELRKAPAPSPGGTAKQPSQHPLYSKVACFRVLDALTDAVIDYLRGAKASESHTSIGSGKVEQVSRAGTLRGGGTRAGVGRGKLKPKSKPKPPFKRGSEVRALWGGDTALGYFPATVQGHAFIAEIRKWTFALAYADGGFDACVKQEHIEGGAEALAAQRQHEEAAKIERQRKKQQRERERQAARHKPWDNGEEETTHDVANTRSNPTYDKGIRPPRIVTKHLKERPDSAPVVPSPNTETLNKRPEEERFADVSRHADLQAWKSAPSQQEEDSWQDTDVDPPIPSRPLNRKATRERLQPPTATLAPQVAALQEKLAAAQAELTELRQSFAESLQVSPSTPGGLATLKHRLLCAENYHLRRRLQTQEVLLRRNLAARDEFDGLLHATLQSARQHLSTLKRQQDTLKSASQSVSASRGRGSGVGAVAAARNKELQAAETNTNAVKTAMSFLRSFVSGLTDVAQRFREAGHSVATDVASQFAVDNIQSKGESSTSSNEDLEPLVASLATQLTTIAARFNSHVTRDVVSHESVSADVTTLISNTLPQLYTLSLHLVKEDARRRARQAAAAAAADQKEMAVDLSFDRVDNSDSPLGQIADVAIATTFPTSFVDQHATQSGSAAFGRAIRKLGIVLKQQLHAFDQRRLGVFRVMQARLAAFDKAQLGDVGYAQRILVQLQQLASGAVDNLFDSVLDSFAPILESYAAVADENIGAEHHVAESDGADVPSIRANNARNNFILTFGAYSASLADAVAQVRDKREQIQGNLDNLKQRHDELKSRFQDGLARNARELAQAMSQS